MISTPARVVCGLVVLCCATAYAGQSDLPPTASPIQQQIEIKDLRAGERYSGGTRVRSPFLGISFVVPKEWRASLPAGAALFLDSAMRPGLGVIHLLADVSREEVVAKLSEPQLFEAGFMLHPAGSVREESNRLVAVHAAGEDVGVTVALLGPDRNAVVYQFVGRKTEQDLYRRLVEELAASTEFMNLEQLRALRSWYERLSGMMLMPKLSADSNQRSASPTIHLCSDGHFITIMKLTPVPGRTKGSDDEDYQETGSWRIEQQASSARLILTSPAGAGRTYSLREDDDRLLLNAQRTEPVVSDRCF